MGFSMQTYTRIQLILNNNSLLYIINPFTIIEKIMPHTEEQIKGQVKNYDRELGTIDAKINYLEKRFERYEIDTAIKLREIKDQNDKLELGFKNYNKYFEEKIGTKFNELGDKIDNLKEQSVFTKGFIRATLLYGSLVGVVITVLIKFIK